MSICYLGAWNWPSVLVALGNSVFIYQIGRFLARRRSSESLLLGVVVGSQLLFLIVLRYWFSLSSGDTGYISRLENSTLIVGVSYMSLRHISYLIDVNRRTIDCERSFFAYLFYIVYFPTVLVGPIEAYSDFRAAAQPKLSIGHSQFNARAFHLIALGLFKHYVISNRLLEVYAEAGTRYGSEIDKPILFFWLTAIATFFVIYSDFSGLVDIGRGVSSLLGIELSANFDLPYFAGSPSEYWRRWHISLGIWMKKYVFVPTLLRTQNTYIAIATTMFAVAAWHGFYKELMLWAALWTVFQCLQLFLQDKFGKIHFNRNWPFRFVTTFLTFHISAFIGLFTFHRLLFNIEKPLWPVFSDDWTWHTIKQNWVIGIFIFLTIGLDVVSRQNGRPRYFFVVTTLGLALLTAMYMKPSSYIFYYMRL